VERTRFVEYAQITNNPELDGCINAVLRESIRRPDHFRCAVTDLSLSFALQLSDFALHSLCAHLSALYVALVVLSVRVILYGPFGSQPTGSFMPDYIHLACPGDHAIESCPIIQHRLATRPLEIGPYKAMVW
jgi:hypothetical protein